MGPKTMDSQETPRWLSARELCSESKEKGSPRITGWGSLRYSILSGSVCSRVKTCTSPPSSTGLVQPGNEEMISLSAAAAWVEAVMTHSLCVSCPQGKSPIQWIPSYPAKTISYISPETASFIRDRHTTYILTYWAAAYVGRFLKIKFFF